MSFPQHEREIIEAAELLVRRKMQHKRRPVWVVGVNCDDDWVFPSGWTDAEENLARAVIDYWSAQRGQRWKP